MPRLPKVSATELVRAFQKMGFTKVSQKGSHIKMQDNQGGAERLLSQITRQLSQVR